MMETDMMGNKTNSYPISADFVTVLLYGALNMLTFDEFCREHLLMSLKARRLDCWRLN